MVMNYFCFPPSSWLALILMCDPVKNVSYKFCGLYKIGDIWTQFLYLCCLESHMLHACTYNTWDSKACGQNVRKQRDACFPHGLLIHLLWTMSPDITPSPSLWLSTQEICRSLAFNPLFCMVAAFIGCCFGDISYLWNVATIILIFYPWCM